MTESQDATLGLAKLAGALGVMPDPTRVLVFTHRGTPIPKARARFSRKHNRWYTPGDTEQAEQDLAWQFKAALGRRHRFEDTVALVALFFVPDRHRKDVDNCLKLVMDAATKASIWRDDSQVVVQAAYLALDPKDPRTVVALAPCLNSLSITPLLLATGAI